MPDPLVEFQFRQPAGGHVLDRPDGPRGSSVVGDGELRHLLEELDPAVGEEEPVVEGVGGPDVDGSEVGRSDPVAVLGVDEAEEPVEGGRGTLGIEFQDAPHFLGPEEAVREEVVFPMADLGDGLGAGEAVAAAAQLPGGLLGLGDVPPDRSDVGMAAQADGAGADADVAEWPWPWRWRVSKAMPPRT